jgi:ATP-dependent Clp protease ATP-binding subunit ClpA
VLVELGIAVWAARAHASAVGAPAENAGTGRLPFTQRATGVLERALREALALGHGHVGTEHLLLSLAREERGAAAQVLKALGSSPEAELAREVAKVRRLLGELRCVRRELLLAMEARDMQAIADLRAQEAELLRQLHLGAHGA